MSGEITGKEVNVDDGWYQIAQHPHLFIAIKNKKMVCWCNNYHPPGHKDLEGRIWEIPQLNNPDSLPPNKSLPAPVYYTNDNLLIINYARSSPLIFIKDFEKTTAEIGWPSVLIGSLAALAGIGLLKRANKKVAPIEAKQIQPEPVEVVNEV